jgi:Zn-dependent protease
MFKSWRIGRLLGFPIEINLSFLILLGLVLVAYGGLVGVLVVSLAFAFVLLHELGHAVVARRLGVDVSGIELGFLGGAAKMTSLPRTANAELLIAAAGPAVSLVLGGAGLGLAALFHSPMFALVGWINLVIAGFNLIPALPMDGGRILRAALSKYTNFVRATDISVTVARVVAVGFVIWALTGGPFQLLLLAPFLWIMGTREKLLARMLGDERADYGGRGRVDVMPRGAWDQREHHGWGAPMQRFTIAFHNGRIVIVPLD